MCWRASFLSSKNVLYGKCDGVTTTMGHPRQTEAEIWCFLSASRPSNLVIVVLKFSVYTNDTTFARECVVRCVCMVFAVCDACIYLSSSSSSSLAYKIFILFVPFHSFRGTKLWKGKLPRCPQASPQIIFQSNDCAQWNTAEGGEEPKRRRTQRRRRDTSNKLNTYSIS